MDHVTLLEVSPRDGLQNEEKCLAPAVRAELVRRVVAAGARRVEAVSFVHPGRVPQMAGAGEVMAAVPRDPLVRYAALVLNERGLREALASGVDEVNVVVPCTDTMSMRNQGRPVVDMVRSARAMIAEAKEAGTFVTLTAAVAFGCPFEGEVDTAAVRSVLEGTVGAGVDEIGLADTIGVGVPRQVAELVALAAGVAPGIPLRFHFHNTRNTGYANALAAVDEGVTTLDASIGGFGGCPFAPAATGNVATEDLVYLLERSGYTTGVDLDSTTETAAWLGEELDRRPAALLGAAGSFP
jgi:isopropylmalate/homocitrate/citramalate synthase